MKNSAKNKVLWISGLLTGVVVGAYLYSNRSELEPQKKKLNKLLGEFQSIAGDLKDRLLTASEEGYSATKTAINSAKETAKEKMNTAKETAKENLK